jgi:glycosyltransferase involved in cell wall biosynthesis
VVTSFQGSDLLGRPRPDGSFSGASRTIHRRLCRYVARRSSASIVKARWMKDVVGQNVHVVPNGVDLATFHPVAPDRRRALRRDLGIREEGAYVLFCASPANPRKRFPLASAAVSHAAGRLGRPVELIVLHGRTHEDVARFMQACDLLILTSTYEGSPNVVKEALACGMRVASIGVGDVRERLERVSGCRVAAGESPEAIGAAVAELLASEEPAGGPEAVAPLEIGAVARRIREIYAGVLSATSPASPKLRVGRGQARRTGVPG